MIDQFLNDLRFGARVLIKNPGSTLLAILVLAIGIGANTTIFSVVDSVLLRPLRYRDSERLVMVWQTLHKDALVPLSLPDYFEVISQSNTLEQISAAFLNKEDYSVTGQGEPEQINGMAVSANLFATLGVSPSQGRNFQPDEDKAGHERVVIISHALWTRKFGRYPSVLGRLLTIDGAAHEIIGVMPAGFQFPPPISSGALRLSSDRDLWIPYVPLEPSRQSHPVAVIARLKPDAQLATARAEIETIMQRMERQYPDTNAGIGGGVVSMRELVVQNARRPLWLLLGAVGLVLLVACANIANLLLVRAEGRRREMAIRTALGAGRGRLASQLLIESMLLSTTGGLAGLVVTLWGVDLLRTASSSSVPRLAELRIDPSVLGFTLFLSIATGVLFGLAPALLGSRPDLAESLKQGGRGLAGTASGRLRNILVIAEVAIAVILLVGGGLLVRSFMRLLAVDPGFNLHNLQTAGIRLPAARYHDDQRIVDFTQRLIQRVERLPGVVSAGTINSLPISGFKAATLFYVEGRPHPASFAETPMANGRSASPGYWC
jgi:putative ABC transport system permease protein